MVIKIIKTAPDLKKINLGRNDFSSSYGMSTKNNKLLKALARNENLTDIDLQWNNLIQFIPEEEPDYFGNLFGALGSMNASQRSRARM
jgi:hypothetical protein